MGESKTYFDFRDNMILLKDLSRLAFDFISYYFGASIFNKGKIFKKLDRPTFSNCQVQSNSIF